MSRSIDLSKPLSEEDRAYLESRGEMHKIASNDAEHADGSGEVAREYSPSHSLRVGNQTVSSAPGGDNPAPASLGARQRLAAQEGTEEVVYESDDRPYEDWKNADLEQQAEARGLPKSGNKQELADRLRDWDADSDDAEEDKDGEDE